MKRKFLRNVSIVIGLALCFCVGSWAMVSADDEYVAKVNDTPYKTLAEAFNAANHLDNNPTVTILKDVKDVSKPFSLSKSMTIDLNGKEITTITKSDLSRLIWIDSNATVNITDSKGGGSLNLKSDKDADIYTILMSRATLNLEKGIISCLNDRSDSNARSSVIGMGSQGSVVNLKGSTLSSKGGVISFGIVTGGAAKKENVPTFNFTSGKIEIDNDQLAWGIFGNGNVNVTGGEMTVNGKSQVYLFYFTSSSDHTGEKNISGGTFTATGVSSATGILYGPVTVTGGKFKVTTTGDKSTPHMLSDTGTFNIRGGYYNLPFDTKYIPDGYRVKELTSGAAYDEGYRYEVIPRKFHLDVTGYAPADDEGNRAKVPVSADVYSDYGFVVTLPEEGKDEVGADKATVNISLTGVQSLGLKEGETRSYTKTVETGLGTGISAALHGGDDHDDTKFPSLNQAYYFEGATCPVKIIADGQTKEFSYSIAGTKDYQIVGTPSSTDDARAAWQLMISHVKANQDLTTDDTHFLFKKGSYLQIGDERLVFLNDFDFLKGSATLETLFDGANVRIEKANVEEDNTLKAAVYLPEGSTLGVSSSNASVTEDVKVTMDAIEQAKGKLTVTNFFTKMKENSSKLDTKVAIAMLVSYFNQIVGMVDDLNGCNFTVEFTQPKDTPKFHVDVTGVSGTDNHTPIAVNADVYGDYSFIVSLPDNYNDSLSASRATLNVSMTGVQSLGLKKNETRSYSKTVETGVDGGKFPLHNFLQNTYAFKGVNCPVTIKDGKDTKSLTYNIAGINEDYQIVGTPDNEDDARAAWQFMVNNDHLNAGKVSEDDAHFLFKKGAYIRLGNQALVFTSDFDFLEGGVKKDASLADLFKNAEVEDTAITENGSKILEVFLPVGSTLGLSSSAATVKQNVKITMNGADLASNSQITNFFSNLKNNENLDTKVAIAGLVFAFDAAIGEVEKTENVSFTIEFTRPDGKVYFTDANHSDWSVMEPVIATDGITYDIDGDNLTGFRVEDDQEHVNINFTRKFTAGVWAAWVAPFDLEVTSDLLSNFDIGYIGGLSGQNKQGDIDKEDMAGVTIVLKKLKVGQTVKANQTYFFIPKSTGSKTFQLKDVTLKKTEENSVSVTINAYAYTLTGIYIAKPFTGETQANGSLGWYYVDANGNFSLAYQNSHTTGWTVKPFRFFLEITDNPNNPYAAKPSTIGMSFEDEATGIKGIENANVKCEQKIFDLQGRLVTKPGRGVYIVNGHKVVFK